MNEFNVGDLVILKSVGFVPKNQMVVSAIFQDLQGKTIVRCLWKNEENDYIAETA